MAGIDITTVIKTLPTILHFKGIAVSREVYTVNGAVLDKETTRNYNWGVECSGAIRLAIDLFKLAGCREDTAEYLAPTLSKYILSKLPDTFEVKLSLKRFMQAVVAQKLEVDSLYDTFVVEITSSTPVYVEVTKGSYKPDDVAVNNKVVPPTGEPPVFVNTAHGRRRADISKRLTDALEELNTDT